MGPHRCTPLTPAPTPSPATPKPTPAPDTPSPTPPAPQTCPGGSMSVCLQLCPGDAGGYKACSAECARRCESELIVLSYLAAQRTVLWVGKRSTLRLVKLF